MRLTALEIKKKQFEQKMRGCDPIEVQAFLDLASAEVELLTREKKEAEERLSSAVQRLDHYLSLESTLERTLVAAQQTAMRMEDQARKEAELILRDAELQRDRKLNDVRVELERAEQRASQLRTEYASTLARMRGLLSGFTSFVDELDAENAPVAHAAVPSASASAPSTPAPSTQVVAAHPNGYSSISQYYSDSAFAQPSASAAPVAASIPGVAAAPVTTSPVIATPAPAATSIAAPAPAAASSFATAPSPWSTAPAQPSTAPQESVAAATLSSITSAASATSLSATSAPAHTEAPSAPITPLSFLAATIPGPIPGASPVAGPFPGFPSTGTQTPSTNAAPAPSAEPNAPANEESAA